MWKISEPGARARFVEWIGTRGGVLVWPNADVGSGDNFMYTPAKTVDGKNVGSPHWSRGKPTLVKQINQFRFVELEEVKRFHVAVCRGRGFQWVLTAGSKRKLCKALSQHQDASYSFDYSTQEAVISVPKRQEGADGNG